MSSIVGSEMVHFDGKSYLLYTFNHKSVNPIKEVFLWNLKPERTMILLHREGPNDKHITLELIKGKLILFLNSGKRKKKKRCFGKYYLDESIFCDEFFFTVMVI